MGFITFKKKELMLPHPVSYAVLLHSALETSVYYNRNDVHKLQVSYDKRVSKKLNCILQSNQIPFTSFLNIKLQNLS